MIHFLFASNYSDGHIKLFQNSFQVSKKVKSDLEIIKGLTLVKKYEKSVVSKAKAPLWTSGKAWRSAENAFTTIFPFWSVFLLSFLDVFLSLFIFFGCRKWRNFGKLTSVVVPKVHKKYKGRQWSLLQSFNEMFFLYRKLFLAYILQQNTRIQK